MPTAKTTPPPHVAPDPRHASDITAPVETATAPDLEETR